MADEFFNEALRRIAKLHAGNGVLALRAHKNYGKFLATRSRCLSRARQQLEYAKQLAVTSRLDEECADISLKMEQVDLDERKDPRRKTFKLLKGKGYRLHATSKQVLAAWHQYLGNMEAASEGLGFARDEQPPSETYLDNLLRSVMDKLQ